MNPVAWLEDLYKPNGYKQLLEVFGGDIALAAHRLAHVKCMASSLGEVPTSRELYAAALEISMRSGDPNPVPSKRALVAIVRDAGLAVL